MQRRAWAFYPVAMVPIGAAYLLGPSFLNAGPVFNLIGASSIAAILVGARLNKPERRLPWYLFALGQALFVSGDIIAYNYERFFHTALPFPSIADALYLAVYPSLVAGILILIHRRNPSRDRASLVDSLIIAIGVGVLSWVFLMAPYAHDASLSLPTKLISIAYPLMDVLVLAAIVRMAVGSGKRGTAFHLLGLSVVALLATDATYGWLQLHSQYTPGGLLDGGWIAFYALFGAAALHPSMRTLSEPTPDKYVELTRRRLAILAGAALMAPAVELVQFARGANVDLLVTVSSSAALFLLVVARMAGLVRNHEQAVKRERALREAGAKLVTATDREHMYVAALDAARTLAGDDCEISLCLSTGSGSGMTVVATTEEGPDEGPGEAESQSLRLDNLPERALARLQEGRSTEVSKSDLVEDPKRVYGQDATVFLSPLLMREDQRGILVTVSPEGLPRQIKDGLEALAFTVALALESAALTADLQRNKSEARFGSLVQNSSDFVAVIEADTTMRYVSPSAERVLGYKPDELKDTKFADLVHESDRTRALAFLSGSLGESRAAGTLIEFRMQHRDGHWPHVETLRTNLLHDPNVDGIVLNTRDISERKAFEEQLAHQAFHDPLTGLANRALFRDRVEHALERERRGDRQVAVLLLDLDDFRTVNDSLGHSAGDHLMREAGRRIVSCLRSADTAARFGGDEFSVLIENVKAGGAEAADVADRIMKALVPPFELEGNQVFLRASLGIALGDLDARGAEAAADLLRNADLAMYMAKEQGKGRYQMFEPAMHETVVRRLELKADLQRAVECGEFVLEYQPIVVLETSEISGVEALVRWKHPERGMMPPGEFIPLAEDTGLIVEIGGWVLGEACTEAVRLQKLRPRDPPISMSVNIAAAQLERPEIVAEVREALRSAGAPPQSLILEITETAMMQAIDLSILRLHQLKELGVRVAVDDFGTGFSSLNYIRRFPVDVLKIDKSFIDNILGGEERALTGAIIELGEILGLVSVAEGIEQAEQVDVLTELRCQLGQGFHFARPLPREEIEELLGTRARAAA